MSDKNGNGDGDHSQTPLEAVQERIATRLRLETVEVVPMSVPPSSSPEEDPLTAWKMRVPGQPVTLEQIHAGLIATCEYSEAAIEGGLRMAADVHEVVKTVDQRTQQIAILTAKAESTSAFVHKVDDELASNNEILKAVRKDVQFLKDDVREIKEYSMESARQLPVIKEMLAEIIGRLPAPVK
jgi:hypothetical protein